MKFISTTSKASRSKLNPLFILLSLTFILVITGVKVQAQFSIAAGSTNYTQDFNTLTSGTWTDNSTLTGWYARTDATASITSYGANTGSTTTAGLYAFGVAGVNPLSDRAIGYAPTNAYTGASGTGKGYIGWRLKNNTGSTITSVTVTWTGEQWRKDNFAGQTLKLFYQTGVTVADLTSGSWTDCSSVFTSPQINQTAAAIDGNAAANRVAGISVTITVTIPAGNEIMLRWEDLNDSGNDHYMAIDDVTVNAALASPAPEINLKQGSTNIPSGGSFGFGTIVTGSSSAVTTFTIENTGNANLNLTGTPIVVLGGTNQDQFSVNQTATTTPVAGGSNTTFTITFSPTSIGSKTATISIANNDADENPYTFTITGTGTTATAPEINIKQNTTNIATGGTFPFGSVVSGTAGTTTTFTIENLGTAALNLTGNPIIVISGTNASEFTVDQLATTTPVAVSGTTTFTITFSPTTQGAKTAAISIANDDADENPYTINLTGTGTVSAASDIIPKTGYTYPTNIDYTQYQTTNITGGSNDIEIAQFTIRDGGAAADADNLGTTLNQIVFTVGNYADIRRIALYDGVTEVGTEQAGAATVTFSGLSLTAADGGTKDFSVRVSFNSTVTDNDRIQLTVTATTSAAATGSTFAATNAGGATTSASGNDNKIVVSATKLLFVVQPSNTEVNVAMSPNPTVKACDANNNTDVDYSTAVSVISSGTLTGSPVSGSWLNGVATFSSLVHTATGTGLTLTASSGSITSVTSNTFNVTSGPIYYDNFGTTPITGTTIYNGTPVSLAANLSSPVWTSNNGNYAGFAGYGGGSSASLSLAAASATRSFTFTFNVALGYQLDITSFDFWGNYSSGSPTWSMKINNITVGSGSIPSNNFIGQTNVSNAISGLTGTVTLVYTMVTTPTSSTVRLDEFKLWGAVTPLPTPEMDVQGNGTSIADGDVTPSTSDWTDFGSAIINSGSIDRTFTILNLNSGTSDLILNGTPKVAVSGANASEFTVTTQPSSPVTVGNSTTFTVHFAPTAAGIRSATLTIANNDLDENPYDFSIQGTGILPECSGTPTGGTASATPSSATCITDVVLSLAGQTVANGITLQWQFGGGSSWTNISPGNTNPFTVVNVGGTTTFRCLVTCTNSGYSAPSSEITVTINSPTGGTTAASVNPVCSGSTTTLSLTGATTSGVTWAWESSTDGSTYTPIGGATSSTYIANPIVNTYYRCKLTCSTTSTFVYSTPLQVTMNTAAVNVTSPSASVDNLQSLVGWTLPSCFSQILVVASAGAANTGTPSGDGSAYTANEVFGNGTALGNGSVVYNNNGSSVLVTGLANGTQYFFKIFTRNGTNWSGGIEVNATPALVVSAINSWVESGNATAWHTAANWSANHVPTTTEVARWNNTGAATTCGINIGTGAPTILGLEVTSLRTRSLLLGGSGSTSGNLTLTGGVINNISNVIIRNASDYLFTLQPTQSNSSQMSIALANATNNIVLIDGAGGITISSVINGSNKNLTLAGSGSGVLTLEGANTYTGTTTVSSSTLRLNRTGGTTLPVTNNVVVNGGTLQVSTNQTLNNLDLTSGNLTIDASATLTINGTFTYTSGTISGSGTIAYGASGTLKYNGSSAQTTSSVELPLTNYPNTLIINNSAGVTHSGSATVNNLTVSSGAFKITSGASLITYGTITGSATVERSITANKWHFISPPISDANSTIFHLDYLQTWTESTHTWAYILNDNVPLVAPIGYSLYRTAGDNTYSFSGLLNTGTKSVGITHQATSGENIGANLVGNPYPSYLDWDGLRNTYGAIYYWDGTGYKSWNNGGDGSRYAAPAQGFFIVTATDGSFQVTNANRTNTAGTWYKSGQELRPNTLVLETSGNSYTDKLFVEFNPEAGEAFDLVHDAYKFVSTSDGISQLYSYTGDNKLSIDVRPSCEVIQLGFTNTTSGQYQIGISEMADISKATLEDVKTGAIHNLLNGPYTFDYTAGEDDKRFKLKMGTVGIEEPELSVSNIYSWDKTAIVDIPDNTRGNIYIYNLAGQPVAAKESVTGQVRINLSPTGVYVVKVVSDKETLTKKVWIR